MWISVGKDESADRIGNGGVLLYAPVVDVEVVVDDGLVVDHSRVEVTDLLTLTAVDNVGLGNVVVACLDKHRLNAVLNMLNRDLAILDLGLEVGGYLKRQKVHNILIVLLLAGIKGLTDSVADPAEVEGN